MRNQLLETQTTLQMLRTETPGSFWGFPFQEVPVYSTSRIRTVSAYLSPLPPQTGSAAGVSPGAPE